MNQKQLKEIIVSRSYGETRLAILEGRKITHIEKESVASNMNVGNIYSAKVTSFEKSLNAFFVDYGGNRPGFLPNKNTVSTLKVGDVILIQIERGERDAKGAAVTQDISIASANLVIMPHNKKAGGISTKLSDENRKKLRDTLDKLHAKNPEMGVIIRTSGIEKNLDEIEHVTVTSERQACPVRRLRHHGRVSVTWLTTVSIRHHGTVNTHGTVSMRA